MLNDMYPADPNLIAEAYRNSNLQMPKRIEKHFDFIDRSDDGYFLLGTSNLSGRIWSGSIWVFENYPTTLNIENCVAGIEFESSIASGLWLDQSKRLIIGCDSGSLYQLSLNLVGKGKDYFTTHGIVSDHDDSIISMTLLNNKSNLVTGSMDMNIKVWDAETLVCKKSYCPAHAHMVTSVSSLIENNDIFLSTSLDGTSLLWDTRLEKPASLLVKNDFGFTSSEWLDENTVAVGSNDGSVSLVDLRMKNEYNKNILAKRPIFKIKYNKKSDLLAVCSDDPYVRVLNCSDNRLTLMYQNEEHQDFVRGLTWDESSNILYSCGWDSKVFLHNMSDSYCNHEEKNEKKEEK